MDNFCSHSLSAAEKAGVNACASNDESLSGDSFILRHGNILSDAAEGADRVIELLRRVDAFSHRKRVRVVEHLHLGLASDSVVHSLDARILLVEPAALDICLLLWVILLRVNFSNEI